MGEVITVSRMTVDRDGKVMKITVEDKLRKATISWTLQTSFTDVAEINQGRQ